MSPGLAEPIVTLAEAQAFARVETGEEEALLAGLIRSASGLCESFLGQVVVEKAFAEPVTASSSWQRLQTAPVRSISSVTQDGTPIPADGYAVDVDSSGCGWIRITSSAISGTVEVAGTAGIAASRNGVPEPIRQGVLRLVAHLCSARDGAGGEIPAAVTALWRPYRRIRFA